MMYKITTHFSCNCFYFYEFIDALALKLETTIDEGYSLIAVIEDSMNKPENNHKAKCIINILMVIDLSVLNNSMVLM